MKTLNKITLIILLFTIVMSSCQSNTSTESKTVNEPSVFFKNIQNGAILSSPFLVEMGVEGMEVEAAGQINDLRGHHHIIINSGFITDGEIVPANAQHIHFGLGQTETTLDLDAGNYTLTLQFADGMHQSYGEGMSKTINVTVR